MTGTDSDNQNLIPEFDLDFLKEKEYSFKIVQENGKLQLVINDFPFPAAYQPRNAQILIELPPGYPNTRLDMFWTFPDVRLLNGATPAATQHHQIFDGKNWQRWSRHLTTDWRPGIDNLRTFITAITSELKKGI